jgi:hypothetical protein
MSRILKRPMFRRGGSSNEGIMTGLVDRKKYSLGSLDKENIASNVGILEEVLREYTPKTPFPTGAVGAGLVRGEGFRESLINPYLDYIKKDDAREAGIKGGAAKLGIGKALETGKIPTTKSALNTSNETIGGIPPGKVGFVTNETLLKNPGKFTDPPAPSEKITFNPQTNEFIIEKGGSAKAGLETKAIELKNATFAMNNVANTMLKNLEGSKVGAVGATISALNSVGAQLSQLAQATGFKNNFVNTGSGAIQDYLKKNLGEGIFADAVQYGKIESNAINLAYLMARVDEPGGRFTDRDIALKMKEIGIGSDPQKTAQILAAAVDLRNKNAKYAYKQLTDKDLSFEGFGIEDIFAKPKDTKSNNDNPLGLDESLLAPIE